MNGTGKIFIIKGSLCRVITVGKYNGDRCEAKYDYAASEDGNRYYDADGDA